MCLYSISFISLRNNSFVDNVCNDAFALTTVWFLGVVEQPVLLTTDAVFTFHRPHSTDSHTHRKMTLSIADRFSKAQVRGVLSMWTTLLFSVSCVMLSACVHTENSCPTCGWKRPRNSENRQNQGEPNLLAVCWVVVGAFQWPYMLVCMITTPMDSVERGTAIARVSSFGEQTPESKGTLLKEGSYLIIPGRRWRPGGKRGLDGGSMCLGFGETWRTCL